MSLTSFLDRLKKRIQQRAALLARPRGRLRVMPLEDRRLLDASFGIEAGSILNLSHFDAGDDLQISGDAASGQASFTLKSGVWDASAPGLAGPFELSADGRTLSLTAAVDTIRIAGTPSGQLQSVSSADSVQVSHLEISDVDQVTLTSAANDFDTLQVDATSVSVVDADDLTLKSVTADSLTIDASGALTDTADANVNLTGTAQLSADSIVLGDTAADQWRAGSLTFASGGDVSISADGDLQLGTGSSGDRVQLSAGGQILGGTGLELAATEVRLEAGTEPGADAAIGTIDALVSVDADVLHTSGGDQFLESERVTLGTLHSDGTIHLEAGTFVTDADTDLSGTLSLGDDAILKGDGDVAEVSLTSGSLQPGNSPGIINTGDFDLGSGSTLLIEVQGTTPGTEHDQVNVTGTVTLSGGSLSVDVLPPYTPAVGDSYVIINNDGVDAVTGTFAGLAEGAVFTSDGELFTVSYVGGDGNDVVLSSTRHEFDFSATNFSATESAGTISGSVTRSGFADVATSVDVVVAVASGATAAEASDFTQETITLNFAAGETSQNFAVTIVGDAIVEDNEIVALSLSGAGAGGAVGSTIDSATATINNDDTATLSISNVTVTESDANQNVNAVVTLSAEVEGGITVAYASALGTAEAGDVTVSGTSLSFAGTAGETENIAVTIVGDEIVEDSETFSITLGNVTGTSAVQAADITTGAVSSGTINNDDTATLSISNITVTESDANQNVNAVVTLSAEVEGGITVAYASALGTAEAGDVTVSGTSLSFAGTAGETENIAVTIVGDEIVEDSETFSITLGNVTGTSAVQAADITTGAVSSGTINNDDTATLSISNITVTESDANQNVNAVVTLSAEVEGGITVAYASALGTAEAGDVTVSGTSLSFAGTAGETENIAVTIVGDEIVEDSETFSITLGDVTGTSAVQDADITTGAVSSGTINNDDTATLSISTINTAETNANQNVTATVSVDAAVEGGFTVAYSDTLLTAEVTDYSVSGSSIAFAGNLAESHDITVTLVGDTIVEADETFRLTLGDVTGTSAVQDAAITTGAQSVNTISNDDQAQLSINDVTVNEGDGTATFTVTSTNATEEDIDFSVALNNGSTSAADVTLATTAATISGDSSSTTTSVTVNITDDRRVEGQETYSLTLSAATWNSAVDASRATIADGSAAGAVNDNETVDVSFATGTSTVAEDTSTTTIDVDLTISSSGSGAIGLDQTIAVDVNRTGGTASVVDPDADVSYTDTTLSFSAADGDAASFTKSVTVATFEDILDDDAETLELSLQSLSDGSGGQALIGATNTHTLTITDDDSAAAVFDLVAGGGDVVITANGANLEVYVGGVLQTSRAFADVTSLLVQGTADNESLTLDFSNGVFTTDVTFDGAAGDDTIFIVGATGGSDVVVSYSAVDPEAGQVTIDGTTLSYQDIENNSLNISGTSDLTLEFAGGDPNISITRLNATQTQVTGDTFTTTNFTSPADSLTLNFSDASNYTAVVSDLADDFNPTGGLSVTAAAGGGDTDLTIDQLGGLSGRAVAIDLGGGTDSVLFQNTAQSFGSLSVTAEAITATTAALTVSGTTTLDAGAGGDVTLSAAANNFMGAVTITNARDVVLDDANAVTFASVSVARDLTVDSGGGVDFSATAVIGQNLDIETDANGGPGAITDSTGQLSVVGTTVIDAGTSLITLDNAANTFGGDVSMTAVRAELAAASAVSLATVTTQDGLTVTAGEIDLVNTVTAGGAVVLTASTGSVTDSGAGNLQAASISTLSAAVDVLLDNAANDFGNQVTVTSARDVSLADANTLLLSTVNASRDLTLSAAEIFLLGTADVGGNASLTSTGGIADVGSGRLEVTGTTTLQATGVITLDAAAGDFGQAVMITSAVDATLVDVNDLTFGTSGVTGVLTATATAIDLSQTVTTSGALSLTATVGSITDSTGQANVTGTATLQAAGDVVLDAAGNQLGVINADATNVTIVDSTVLDIGLISATAAVVLTSANSIQDATSDSTVDVTAASLDLNAATGIGSLRAVEISVASVTADSTSGDIDLDSVTATAVTVASLTTGDGRLAFDQSGGGDVTFSGSVSSGGAVAGGDITLTSTAGLTVSGTSTVSSQTGSGGTLTISGASVQGQVNVGGGNIVIAGGGPDLVIAADLASDSDVILNAARDVIVGATVDAGGSIVITADTNAGTDTGSGASGGHGGVQVTAAGLLNATSDVSVSGSDLFATAGTVDAIVVAADGANTQVSSGGSVTIGPGGNAPAASATIINGRVTTTALAGTVDISAAGDVLLGADGDVSAQQGQVAITGNAATGSGGRIVMDDGAQITTTTGDVVLVADGNILLGQLSTASTVTVTTASGAIVDNGDTHRDIMAASVALSAQSGIGDDASALDTQAAGALLLLAATTDSGDIHISNSGAVVVGNVGGIVGLTIADNAGVGSDAQDSTLDNITLTAASPLTINAAITNNDGGGIALASTNDGGADDHLTINAALTVTGGDAAVDGTGNIVLNAGTDLVIAASLSTDGGGTVDADAVADIRITAGAVTTATGGQDYLAGGSFQMTDGTLVQSTAGDVQVAAATDVTVAAVAAAGRVSISSATGQVVDAGDAAIDIVASELVVTAVTGIGTAGELETSIDRVAFSNSTSGDVRLTNSQALEVASLGSVTTSANMGGNIELCLTTGDLNVATALAAVGNTIRLQTDSGTISQSSSGVLTAMALGTRATGSVTLNVAANDVTTLAAASTVAGSVAFNDVNGFTVGSVAAGSCFAATAGVTTAAGDVSLTASDGNLINVDGVTAGGTGNVNLTASGTGSVELTGTTTAAGNTVTINSANRINGSGLVTAGTVDLNAASGIGDVTALELAAGVVNADTTVGAIDIDNTLASAVTVSSLTSAAAGTIVFEQAGGGAVDFVSVQSADGDVTLLVNDADLTVSGTATAGAAGNLSLTTVTSGSVLLPGTATAAGDTITVVSANQVVGDGDAAADLVASTLNITSVNGIGSGNALETSVSVLAFSNSTAGDVQVTNSSALTVEASDNTNGNIELCVLTGDLILNGLLTAGTNTIRLQADVGSVTETVSGVINAGQLGVRASAAVTLASNANSVDTFAAAAGTGSVVFHEADGFTVGTVTAGDCFTAVTGVTTTAGDVTLRALAGNLQISDVVTTATGNIDVDADAGALTLDAVVSSTSGSIDLTADSVAQNASVQTGGAGTLAITADNGSLVMTDGTTTTTASGSITLDATQAVDLSQLVSTSGAIAVTAGTAITDNTAAEAANLSTTGQVTLSAATGIGAAGAGDIDTQISLLQATNSTSGDVVIQEADGLTVNGTGVVTSGGNGNISLHTLAGDLMTTAVVSANGSGNVLLDADAGAVENNAAVTSGSGNVSVLAAAVRQNADISTAGAGLVQVTSDSTIVMTDGTTTSTLGGAITYLADADVRLSLLNAGTSAVNVTSTTGSLLDNRTGEGTGSENIIGGVLTLAAAVDVGSADDLDIDAATLDARSTVAGRVNIAESNDVGTTFLQTANGRIDLVAGGSINGVTAVSLTDAAANDILVRGEGALVQVQSLNAGSTGAVTIEAPNGDITGLAGVNVVADNLTATASGNITLDTTIASVTAASGTAGNIVLNETDAVVMTSVTTADGAITVTAGGTITATSVNASGGAVDSVTLTANSGDVVATAVQAADSVTLLAATGSVTATSVIADTGLVDVEATVGDVLIDTVTANGPVAPATAVNITAGNDILDLNGAALNISATGGRTILTAGRDVGFASTDVFKPTVDDPIEVHTAELQISAGRNVAVFEQGSAALTLLTADVAFLTSAGDLDLSAAAVTTDSLSVVAGGTLTLPPAATPLTVNGDLRLEAADVAAAGGVIDINANRLLFKSGQSETLNLTVSEFDGEAVGDLTINNDSAALVLVDLDCDLTAIDVGAGVATINQTTAAVVGQQLPVTGTQNSRILAGGLVLNGNGTYQLTNTTNDINQLAGTNVGAISLADVDDVTVDQIGATVGLTSTDQDILLQAGTSLQLNQQLNAGTADVRLSTAGGIVQSATGVITADELALRDTSTAEIRLAAANDVNVLAVDNLSGGNVTFADSDDLTVGTIAAASVVNLNFAAVTGVAGTDIQLDAGGALSLNEGVTAAAGTADVRLVAGGAVSQTAAGIVTADELGIRQQSAVGDVVLDDANVVNSVSVFNAANGGVVALRNTQDLTAGTVAANTVDASVFAATSGITTNNGNVLLQADQSLQLNATVDAGTADVRINSTTGTAQSASGSIVAARLGVRNLTSGDIQLGAAANDVDVLTARNEADSAAVSFFDADDLIVGQLAAENIGLLSWLATTGVDTDAGDINITAVDDLTVSENINAASDTLTSSVDESIVLISRGGDFQLADNRSISTDEDTTAGVFDDVTGDEITILAGSDGSNGLVSLGNNSEVRTDGGVARQIAPRPTAFAAVPSVGAENAFVTLTDAENSRSNLSFVSGGFLGQLELVFGVAGEENLEVVVDWGVVSQTDFVTDAATDATQIAPGEFAFDLSDADKVIYFIDEGGASYQIPHLYAPADLLTTANDRNGREVNPNIIGVRFSVAQHESINIWGTNATDPLGVPDTPTPVFTGTSPTIVDANGAAIMPGGNLALLSATDTNGLDQFNQEAAQLPLGNLVNTPTGQPEGFAEWEFLAGPSPGVIPVTRFAEQTFDLPAVEVPDVTTVVTNVFGDVTLDSGAAGESAIGTEVYLQIRRHFELDAEAEIVIQRITDNSFISSREAFEAFVEDNPVLQDGDGYEVWLITETSGQKVARPIVEFEITGGRPGPATEELPETFEPYQLQELEFEQPDQPQPLDPQRKGRQADDDETAAISDPAPVPAIRLASGSAGLAQPAADRSDLPIDDEQAASHASVIATQSPADADGASTDIMTDQPADEQSSDADGELPSGEPAAGAALLTGLTLAARWRRKQTRTDQSLSTTAVLTRRLRRAAAQHQESERTPTTDSQHGG